MGLGTYLLNKLEWTWHVFRVTFNTVKRYPCIYAFGLLCCFLVVVITVMVFSLLDKVPILFLYQAELTVGEIDFTIKYNMNVSMSFDSVSNELSQYYSDNDFSIFPRIDIPANTFESDNISVTTGTYPYRYIIGNLKEESKKGIGRSWKYNEKDEKNGFYIHKSISLSHNYKIGDNIKLVIPISNLNYLINPNIDRGNETTTIECNYPIINIIDSAKGKYDMENKNVIFSEMNTLTNCLRKYDSSISINNVSSVIGVFSNNKRRDIYYNQNFDDIKRKILRFADNVLSILNYKDYHIDLNIFSDLKGNHLLNFFLTLLVGLLLFIISLLSSILIYSLLMINTKSRGFEFYVRRMIGTGRTNIIAILLSQALIYSIPAYAVGVGLSLILHEVLCWYIHDMSGLNFSHQLSPLAIFIGAVIGIGLPLIASVGPVSQILSTSLTRNMDSDNNNMREPPKSYNPNYPHRTSIYYLFVDVILIIYSLGFAINIPSSLLKENLPGLVTQLVIILLTVMLSLIFLSLVIEPLMEKLILFIFLFYENEGVTEMVKLNIKRHHVKNIQTHILFSLCLAFILFANISVAAQLYTSSMGTYKTYGSLISIRANGNQDLPYTIFDDLEQLLIMKPNYRNIIKEYAFITSDLPSTSTLSTVGRTVSFPIKIYGVSRNFHKTLMKRYVMVNKITNKKYKDKVGEGLYNELDGNGLILSAGVGNKIFLEPNDEFLLTTYSPNIQNKVTQKQKLYSLMSSCPIFDFSVIPVSLDSTIEGLVSIDKYIEISNGLYTTNDTVLYNKILFDVDLSYPKKEIDQLIIDLHTLINPLTTSIADMRSNVESMNQYIDLTNMLFILMTIAALLLCFFSLLASMITNIVEQCKELAVLRSVGLSNFRLIRIYLWESLATVLTSSIFGVSIGIYIGWSFCFQMGLITESDSTITIPVEILISILIGAVLISILAPLISLKVYINMTIADQFRSDQL